MFNYRHAALAGAALLAAGVFAPAARAQSAAVTLSSPDDLTRVLVGQTVRINVNLVGLGGGSLSGLNASVATPGLLFDAPAGGSASVVAGGIVPNADGFFGNLDDLDPGTIFTDGVYDALEPAGNITADGTFFSFSVVAATPGMGVIDFVVDNTGMPLITAAAADGSAFPLTTADPSGLAVTVLVPEPTGFAVLAGGFGLATLRRRRAAAITG